MKEPDTGDLCFDCGHTYGVHSGGGTFPCLHRHGLADACACPAYRHADDAEADRLRARVADLEAEMTRIMDEHEALPRANCCDDPESVCVGKIARRALGIANTNHAGGKDER